MLFWMWPILIIVGIIGIEKCNDFDLETVFSVVIVTGLLGLIIAGVVLAICLTGIEGQVASLEKEYESLVYQYENDIYENDNDLGKRELMSDIQEWNEKIASNQANEDDFWIGIFIPDIYDQFEFIELKGEV